MPLQGEIDLSFLESLLGYNARRLALVAIERFLQGMQPFGLRPVEFSVLVVIHDNPGITARGVCRALGLQAPNVVGLIAKYESMGHLARTASASDRRASELRLTAIGADWVAQAKAHVAALEAGVAAPLSSNELKTLIALLQKAQGSAQKKVSGAFKTTLASRMKP